MAASSRVSDIGIGVCPAHVVPITYTTTFITGADKIGMESLPMAFVTSIGISTCGHPTVAITGAPKMGAQSQQDHRVGDMGTNPGKYVSITGSPKIGS